METLLNTSQEPTPVDAGSSAARLASRIRRCSVLGRWAEGDPASRLVAFRIIGTASDAARYDLTHDYENIPRGDVGHGLNSASGV